MQTTNFEQDKNVSSNEEEEEILEQIKPTGDAQIDKLRQDLFDTVMHAVHQLAPQSDPKLKKQIKQLETSIDQDFANLISKLKVEKPKDEKDDTKYQGSMTDWVRENIAVLEQEGKGLFMPSNYSKLDEMEKMIAQEEQEFVKYIVSQADSNLAQQLFKVCSISKTSSNSEEKLRLSTRHLLHLLILFCRMLLGCINQQGVYLCSPMSQ